MIIDIKLDKKSDTIVVEAVKLIWSTFLEESFRTFHSCTYVTM